MYAVFINGEQIKLNSNKLLQNRNTDSLRIKIPNVKYALKTTISDKNHRPTLCKML